MKNLILFMLGLGLPLLLHAQSTSPDVLYLKNGAIVKGTVTAEVKGEKVVIDIGENRILTFLDAEILRLVRNGQDNTLIDQVILHNGSVFKGTIVAESSTLLTLRLSNGTDLQFSAKEINEVLRQQVATEKSTALPDYRYISLHDYKLIPRKREKIYEFQEKGWYYTAAMYFPMGGYRGTNQLGVGLQGSAGYQLSRWLGLGLGAGFDAFSPSEDRYMAAVMGEARSYLTKSRVAPFATLGAGYGFAFKPESDFQLVEKASGGLRLHPALGLRLGASKDMNLAIDAGYIFQRASYTYTGQNWTDSFWFWGRPAFNPTESTTRQVIDYRRFTLRLSAIF
jgi:hypothetical protein